MSKELQEYLRILFSLNDPIIYSILIIFIFIIIIYVFYKYVFFPAQKKYLLEKKELEMKGIKLMALFAELDPDPVIRIDEKGTILHNNLAAKILENGKDLEGENIRSYIPSLPENIPELINNNSSFPVSFRSEGKYYEVWFKSLSNLNVAQLYFKDLTERNLVEKELIESRKQLLYLTDHLQENVEKERKRIARELHDSIGQNLIFIKLLLQNSESEQDFKVNVKKVLPALDSTINDLKRISRQLRPVILEEVDLPTAIISLTNSVSIESRIKGDVSYKGKMERFGIKTETSIYRIIQEALTNIVKHSGAGHFDILIMNKEESIVVIISDDGKGIKTRHDPKLHFGLTYMKERAENLNGTFEIESADGKGTTITVSIPKNSDQKNSD